MPVITFIEFDGTAHTVDVPAGGSVMEAAVSNNVPGIEADCGGACACATCHVYVSDQWLEKVGERGELEQSMLEFSDSMRPNSRLSCQIPLTEELDGLVVDMLESQY